MTKSKIKRTGVASPAVDGCCERLHAHVVLEFEWGAFDMGQQSGIDECAAGMGQFLLQQQAEEAQQLLPWPLSASKDAPGTRQSSSESETAQAFCVIFMPCILYSK